jgi:hypothetical protein
MIQRFHLSEVGVSHPPLPAASRPGRLSRVSIDIAERPKGGVLAEEYGPLKARDGVLMTLIVILVVMWLLGMVTTYTLGGLLHILLVIAVILLLVRVIQGRSI